MSNDSLFYTYYDTIFAGKDYDREVAAVLALAWQGKKGFGRILEGGSGTGNHTQAFARLGHTVVGVDIDENIVAVARSKLLTLAPEVAARITYLCGQIEELPVGRYDFAAA